MNFSEQLLSDIAVLVPMSTELFRKNRLDFCCHGQVKLKEACLARGIDEQKILNELQKLTEIKVQSAANKSLSDLADYIEKRFHTDLRGRLPELIFLSDKVEKVHGDHPHCPKGLHKLLCEMHEEITSHLKTEEEILFPLIRKGHGQKSDATILELNKEHKHHGDELDQMHKLTNDFTPPEGACGTWRALYAGVDQLEKELMEHIHLESNVLFPGALKQAL